MNLKTQLELSTMILRMSIPEIKAPEKLILATLSAYGDSKGGSIFPSFKNLSEKTGMSIRAVQDNINKLVDKGFIDKISGGCINGFNTANTYQLNLERLGITNEKTNVIPISNKFIAQDGSAWDCASDYWKNKQQQLNL